MKIDNIQLHEFFLQKNITHLHHANTVATAISFIENGGLLSRGDIERKNAFQTKQASDQEDKLYGVWDDVFLIQQIYMDSSRDKTYMAQSYLNST